VTAYQIRKKTSGASRGKKHRKHKSHQHESHQDQGLGDLGSEQHEQPKIRPFFAAAKEQGVVNFENRPEDAVAVLLLCFKGLGQKREENLRPPTKRSL
jgi:hypothetical protein